MLLNMLKLFFSVFYSEFNQVFDLMSGKGSSHQLLILTFQVCEHVMILSAMVMLFSLVLCVAFTVFVVLPVKLSSKVFFKFLKCQTPYLYSQPFKLD